MGIGIGVGDGVERLLESERPQNGYEYPECRAGSSKLERLESLAVDPDFGCKVGDRHSTPGPGQTYPITKFLGAGSSFRWDVDCLGHDNGLEDL